MKYFFVFALLTSCASSNEQNVNHNNVSVLKEIVTRTGEVPDSLKKGDSSVITIAGKKFTVYSSSSCTVKKDTEKTK